MGNFQEFLRKQEAAAAYKLELRLISEERKKKSERPHKAPSRDSSFRGVTASPKSGGSARPASALADAMQPTTDLETETTERLEAANRGMVRPATAVGRRAQSPVAGDSPWDSTESSALGSRVEIRPADHGVRADPRLRARSATGKSKMSKTPTGKRPASSRPPGPQTQSSSHSDSDMNTNRTLDRTTDPASAIIANFSPGFIERESTIYQRRIVLWKGAQPKRGYAKRHQDGSVMTPLLDPAHPMYAEFEKDRKMMIRPKQKFTMDKFADFMERQKEYEKDKRLAIKQEQKRHQKMIGRSTIWGRAIYDEDRDKHFLERMDPAKLEEKKQLAVERVEDQIIEDLGWIPGGIPKALDMEGEAHKRFMERQKQTALRKIQWANQTGEAYYQLMHKL